MQTLPFSKYFLKFIVNYDEYFPPELLLPNVSLWRQSHAGSVPSHIRLRMTLGAVVGHFFSFVTVTSMSGRYYQSSAT